MPFDWILCDVDGCLTPESSSAWDLPSFLEAAELIRAANQGIADLAPLTLCTGRPQPYVEVLMKLFDVRAPAICENGAVIYTLHDNHARFASSVTLEKIEGLRALRGFLDAEVLPDFPEAYLQFGKESQISVFSQTPGSCFAAIQARVESWLADRGGPAMDISPSHFYLNLSLAGVNKGAAIREVLAALGVPRDRAAGIGDTEGDLPLREEVAFFACPANARPEIKAVADYVSPHAELRGVIDILSLPQLRRS